MKLIAKAGIAPFLLLVAISCEKENFNSPSSSSILSLNESTTTLTLPHYIGEKFDGGTIFYLDPTGEHGLIAAPKDQEGSEMNIYVGNLSWRLLVYIPTGATGQGIGEGKENTRKIIEAQGSGEYAASLCAKYAGGGYMDWYLASIGELRLLYEQKAVVGGFENDDIHWSSTEVSARKAFAHVFSGVVKMADKASTFKVRPIRSF